jgi:hypothetical protein
MTKSSDPTRGFVVRNDRPSPEQQALKKAKWEAKTPYRRFAKDATVILVVIAVLCAIIGAIGARGRSPAATVFASWVGYGSLLLIAALWIPLIWVFYWKLGCNALDNVGAITTPIPSSAEISWQLGQEWGRPATVQEVAAVQQMLINRKNQALFHAGISLGAIYLIGKHG